MGFAFALKHFINFAFRQPQQVERKQRHERRCELGFMFRLSTASELTY